MPDDTKPLHEPMLTHHQWSPVTFILLGQFHNRGFNNRSLKSVWKLHIWNFIQISQEPMSFNVKPCKHMCSDYQLFFTHWGRVTHKCVSKLTIMGPDNGLSPGRHHHLNQCWNIVNSTLGNKLQWNLNRNSNNFIQENAFESVVWKWRPFCLGPNELMPISVTNRTSPLLSKANINKINFSWEWNYKSDVKHRLDLWPRQYLIGL